MRPSSKLPLLVLGATLVAPPALTQTNQQTPQIVTLPSTDRFTLAPSQQSTPAPLPSPVPTPAPSPPPVTATVPSPTVSRPVITKPAVPASTPSKPVQAAPKPVPSPEIAAPKPEPAPTRAVPTPVPTPSATPSPQATATPVQPLPAPAPTAAPAQSSNGSVPVLWLVGGVLLGALASAAFLLRRRRPVHEEAKAERAVAARVEPPAPPVPVPPVALPPAPPPAPQRTGAEIVFQPLRWGMGEQEALLDYELVVTNHGPGTMEDIKALLGIISAQQGQDQLIAAFHASAPLSSGSPVFTLAAGASQQLSGRLTMRRETILPVAVGGRPMIVPIALVNLRWRQGLSIRSSGEAYMVGPQGEGGKLRPIWLDRGPGMVAPLEARLYVPEPQKQALAG